MLRYCDTKIELFFNGYVAVIASLQLAIAEQQVKNPLHRAM